MIVLTVARGWPIVAFALGGFLLSAAYTAPPLRLKKHGLGEPTVLVVWGPLMVGGTYYAATGSIPGAVDPRVAAVRVALHDRAHGQAHRQDPVGRPPTVRTRCRSSSARRVRAPSPRGCSSLFYVSIVALVIARVLPVASVLVSSRRCRSWSARGRRTREPKPEVSPIPNPVWPLWFAASRSSSPAGPVACSCSGLIAGAILGW